MEQTENDAVATFDTIYTNNHIQILKVLLPYFDSRSQKGLVIMIKYMELQYAMEYLNRHPAALNAASLNGQTEKTASKKPDIVEIFEQIKNFCTPSERAMFEQLANMKRSMEMYGQMKEMMELFNQFSPDSSFSDAGDGGQPAADAGSKGDTPFSSSAPEGPNPMEMLKGMLSAEQQAMFEMFQTSFDNNAG